MKLYDKETKKRSNREKNAFIHLLIISSGNGESVNILLGQVAPTRILTRLCNVMSKC